MKISGRTLRFGWTILVGALLSACGGGGGGSGNPTPTPQTPTPQTQTISFANAGPVSGAVGTTVTNAASGGQGTGAITYASSNTIAVTVDAAGVATAVGAGTATITATKAADANYAQAQATYTINAQLPDKLSAYIGASGTEVSLPSSANGKQFGRARVADCTATDTVATCANAELSPITGASITDTRATLTTPAYYALVNGATVGTPINVRPDRFGNRIGHAVVGFKNRYWVIGGGEPIWPADINAYQYTAKADVWSSTDGKSWKLETADGGFGARWFHNAVVFNNRIWILSGGAPSGAPPFYTDVWSSADGVTWQRETTNAQLPWWSSSLYIVPFNNQMVAVSGAQTYASTTGVFTPLSAPGALPGVTLGRQNASLTIYNNQLWFIAGRVHYPLNQTDIGDATNDVLKSSDGITWTQVTANAAFPARYQHSAYVANGKLWVLGGRRATAGIPGPYLGDAWSSTDGATWTQENVNALASGFLMPGVQETDKVTLIGGLQAGFTNHVWQSTDGANWSERTTYAQFSPRLTSGAEFNGQMWIIGGQGTAASGGKSVGNDIWRSSDGVNWTRVVPTTGHFSPRDRHAVVAFNNKLWVIGGWDEIPDLGGTGTRLNDVWSSPDGANWTQEPPVGGTIFSPRLGHVAVVYNGKLWVIGGDVAGGTSNDTINDVWSTTDGKTWVKAADSAAFPAREGHTVAVLNNAMWLTGGDGNSGTALADVWSSTDGITWTQKQPAGTSFSARTHHGAAVLNGRMYVVGGAAGPLFGTVQYNDVWSTADGTTWRNDSAVAAFPGRSLFPLFVHGNELWLSGGLSSGAFNDVWRSSDGVNWRVGFSHTLVAP